MKINPLRRKLIKTLGGSAVALPFMELLAGRSSMAACSNNNRSRRVIFLYHPDGVTPGDWHASGSGTNFSLAESLTPLQSFKNQLVQFRNVEYAGGEGGSHPAGAKKCLVGNQYKTNKSIDREIADTVGQYDVFRHLHLGVMATYNISDPDASVTYSDPGQPVAAVDNPAVAWNNLFGNLGQQNVGPRASILDAHINDLNSMLGQFGATEQAKLNRHLESLRELEKRVTATYGACGVTPLGNIGPYHDYTNTPTIFQTQSDIMVKAMECGFSRVGTLQFSAHTSDLQFDWPSTIVAGTPDNRSHQASHNNTVTQTIQKKWINQQVAYLCQKLKDTPEPDSQCSGSMFDNTVIYVFTEVASGPAHGEFDMPLYIVGGSGGSMNMGRVIDVGRTHNQILVSLAHSMGHYINDFGGHNTGTVAGLMT